MIWPMTGLRFHGLQLCIFTNKATNLTTIYLYIYYRFLQTKKSCLLKSSGFHCRNFGCCLSKIKQNKLSDFKLWFWSSITCKPSKLHCAINEQTQWQWKMRPNSLSYHLHIKNTIYKSTKSTALLTTTETLFSLADPRKSSLVPHYKLSPWMVKDRQEIQLNAGNHKCSHWPRHSASFYSPHWVAFSLYWGTQHWLRCACHTHTHSQCLGAKLLYH